MASNNNASWVGAIIALILVFVQTLKLKLLERRASKLYYEKVKVGIELDKLKRKAEIEPLQKKAKKLKSRIESRRRRLNELQKRLDELSSKSESLRGSISAARSRRAE